MTDFTDLEEIALWFEEIADACEKHYGAKREWHRDAADAIRSQSAENSALGGVIDAVCAILDSNLPLDRKVLASTIHDGLSERVSTEQTDVLPDTDIQKDTQ